MKILLAIDDSKYSRAAAQMVLAQATPGDTEVRVLNVVPIMTNQLPEMIASQPGAERGRDAQRKPAEELVTKTAELVRSRGIKVTTAVEFGNPKAKIIDAAEKWGADLIVMGSHGHKGLARFLLGSVPDAVMRHARCSVQIVRINSAR